MKNKLKILLALIMILSLSLLGCESNSSQVEKYGLLKYKDSYVGDNSSVGNIIAKLPGNIYGAGFSLQTTKHPYGITVNYKAKQSSDVKEYNKFWDNKKADELLEKNAVVLLSLIQNADVVEFNIDNISKKTYKYNRKNLEQKYGKNLKSLFKDDNSFENFLNG